MSLENPTLTTATDPEQILREFLDIIDSDHDSDDDVLTVSLHLPKKERTLNAVHPVI